jgi:hypothetical protein
MRVFLDFEASSLAKASYPIEVGWVFEDGAEESHLIRPAPAWTDWSPAAEALHHIPRERLMAEGEPYDAVGRRMLEALSGHALYVTSPSWDGKWLSVLLRASGLPRHALRLREADEAHLEGAMEILGPAGKGDRAAAVIHRARLLAAGRAVRHRALDDAHQERDLWLTIRRLAEAEVESVTRSSADRGRF